MNRFQEIGQKIRNNTLNIGRHNYALSLCHGVLQAKCCGYNKITAIELGVGHGGGLLDLCKSADYFRNEFSIDIEVYGFDNATGLPQTLGHKDHPEIWSQGQFKLPDANAIKASLPDWAHLVIGDTTSTIPEFTDNFVDSRIGFVSLDLDYYSSTVPALKLFEMPPDRYLPAVPFYVDDVEGCISYNEWCGEAAAINEFNQAHEFRKIGKKFNFNILNFHVVHVLDHPIRTGEIPPPYPLTILSSLI